MLFHFYTYSITHKNLQPYCWELIYISSIIFQWWQIYDQEMRNCGSLNRFAVMSTSTVQILTNISLRDYWVWVLFSWLLNKKTCTWVAAMLTICNASVIWSFVLPQLYRPPKWQNRWKTVNCALTGTITLAKYGEIGKLYCRHDFPVLEWFNNRYCRNWHCISMLNQVFIQQKRVPP